MHIYVLTSLLLALLPTTILANPAKREHLAEARAVQPKAFHLADIRAAQPNIANIYPRQDPSVFTTERTANTQFAPPGSVTPPDPSATGTQTTTHKANTEIIPSPNTGSAPPLITTDSRSANTQAVGPSTIPSSALALPTGMVRMEAVLGVVAVGIAGMV